MRAIVPNLLVFVLMAPAHAATPPDRIHYQGVLRDSADHPVTGTHDVVFRLYDAEILGSEILVDRYLVGGLGGVTFDNGLFSTEIGGGEVLDGSGPGDFTSLPEVFRAYGELWLEIEIGGEVLSPRAPVLSTGHALNADHAETADDAATLGGLPAGHFLDTSGSIQTKSGSLNVSGNMTVGGTLDVSGNHLRFGAGSSASTTPAYLLLQAGTGFDDDLYLQAGAGPGDGRIVIQGNDSMYFESGNGLYAFFDGSGNERASLDAFGNLQIEGSLRFPSGPQVVPTVDILRLQAGFDDVDDLWLIAGNDTTDGRVVMQGDAEISVLAGNGVIQFGHAATSAVTASLDAAGNLQIDGNLSVDGGTMTHAGDLEVGGDVAVLGNTLEFGAGGRVSGTATSLILQGGPDATDDVFLQAGNNTNNGRIAVFGDGDMWFESRGLFYFRDELQTELALLDQQGDLELAGELTVNGNDLRFASGFWIESASFTTGIYGGNDPTDDLFLGASLGASNGSITIYGSSSMEFESGSGQYNFRSGGAASAFLDPSGNLDLDGRLDLDAGEIYLVETGVDISQTLHFREDNLASGERFQWDDAADRFEVSDDFHVFGTLTATTKNFVQNHPYRDDLEIVYTSLEGDEATAFTRGFGRLTNGEARVTLGETFAYVVNPDLGLSAHLTPRGEWANLYVAALSSDELVVRAAPGTPDVAFDFIVFGLRIGHEDFPVLRPKRSESYLPAEGQYDEDRGGDPTLAEATALARYRTMAGAANGAVDIDLGRARALERAIGRRPTQFDYPVGSDRPYSAILAEQRGDGLVDPDAYVTEAVAETVRTDGHDRPPDGRPDRLAGTEPDTARGAPGDVYADSFRPSSSELATMLPAAEPLAGGDVVTIDSFTGRMALSRFARDRAVFGVVAADPGVVLGTRPRDAEGADEAVDAIPVVMSGIVLCKVDAGYGAIRPGDLLTTSETPGHAMRAVDPESGTVLGKALESFDAGTGLISVLVTLR